VRGRGDPAQQTKPGERGDAGGLWVPQEMLLGASKEQMSRKINSPNTAREALLTPRQAQIQRKTTFKDTFLRYPCGKQDVLNGFSIQPSSSVIGAPCLRSWAEAQRNSPSQRVPVTPDDRL